MAELANQWDRHPFRSWHDLDGDIQFATALRSRFAPRPFPVTATPHVLSYPVMRSAWILRLLLGDMLPCDSLICTSRAAAESLTRLLDHVAERVAERNGGGELRYGGRFDVLPLGVDTAALAPASPASRDAARRDFGLTREAFVILWLGRISPFDKADLLPLIGVFGRLTRANPDRDLRLIIGGSGQADVIAALTDYAKRLGVGDRILVTPAPPQSRGRLFAAADVFVSPADNIQETFGITPVEAMACGVPQVVADWSGYRDTVVHGSTGLLIPSYFPPTDAEAALRSGLYGGQDFCDHLLLAQSTVVDVAAQTAALQTLLDRPELRLRMAVASRAHAVSHFDWQVIIGRHEQLWDELAVVADELPSTALTRRDHLTADFSATFGHFATAVLPLDAVARVTASGQAVLQGDEPLPGYAQRYGSLHPRLALELLADIADGPRRTLRASAATAAGRSGLSRATAERHVAWLVKFGFVVLAEETPGSPSYVLGVSEVAPAVRTR